MTVEASYTDYMACQSTIWIDPFTIELKIENISPHLQISLIGDLNSCGHFLIEAVFYYTDLSWFFEHVLIQLFYL